MMEEVVGNDDDDADVAMDESATQNIEEVTEAELSSMMEDDDFIEEEAAASQQQQTEPKAVPGNRGFQEVTKKTATAKPDLSKWCDSTFVPKPESAAVDVQLEQGSLPLVANAEGEQVLRLYWLDAYEDPFRHPGTVWLFGKVYIEKAKAFVSCCLTVRNVKRQVFLLKRENRYDGRSQKEVEGHEVSMDDVYKEFNEKVAERYKIAEFRTKTSEKLYAFEHVDVPNKADYLEVQYSARFAALPSDLKGETFSRVFGANQSSLESFLIGRKLKGPAWLDVKLAKASSPPTSWCKVEAVCESPAAVSVVLANAPAVPPLTVMAVNLKTTINPKTMLNEIAMVSALVHTDFYLDRSAPKQQPFTSHFCALTRPADEVWPFDLAKALAQRAAKGGHRIEKMDSERALLGFLVAKIGKLDPDIIIGHDVTGFDLDVLVHRTVANKIPHWSRPRPPQAQPGAVRARPPGRAAGGDRPPRVRPQDLGQGADPLQELRAGGAGREAAAQAGREPAGDRLRRHAARLRELQGAAGRHQRQPRGGPGHAQRESAEDDAFHVFTSFRFSFSASTS